MGRLVEVALGDGRVQETGVQVERLSSFSLSPDGARVAVGHHTEGISEVLMIENLVSSLKAGR
jgi:hypothetical protein